MIRPTSTGIFRLVVILITLLLLASTVFLNYLLPEDEDTSGQANRNCDYYSGVKNKQTFPKSLVYNCSNCYKL